MRRGEVGAYAPPEAGDPARIGPYRIVGRLGRGGMGRVYLGVSPGGRAVAVKVVHAELAGDPGFRRRFVREVAAARRVTGPFTASVVDADPEGDPPWLATEYVPGMSLRAAVAAHGPWPERSVRALGAGLAEALEAVHGAGVVHRDLKPSNVLLAADGPRLIDFGISLAAEGTRVTLTGAMVGTPGFMSPEQVRGGSVGPASDVFALGAVLVHAAAGAGPFGGGSVHALNYRVVHEAPDLTGLPSGLADVAARCLAKDPGARPAVSDLLAELGAAARDGRHGGPPAEAGWLPEPVTAELTREYAGAVDAAAETIAEPVSTPIGAARHPGPPETGPRQPGASGGGRLPSTRNRVLAGLVAVALAAVVAAVLVPDSGSGAGPAAPPGPPELRQLWSHGTEPRGRPVVLDGKVYFASDGAVQAVDAATGGPVWERGTGYTASMVAVGGTLYTAGRDEDEEDMVSAVDAASGRRLWEYAPGSLHSPDLAVADGTVVFTGDAPGGDSRVEYIHAVGAGTGAKVWDHRVFGSMGEVAAADGTVYYSAIPYGGGPLSRYLYALDARTGEQRWRVRVGGDIGNLMLSLTAAGDVLYAVREDGVLAARDLEGRLLWEQGTGIEDFDDTERPTVAGGVVLVGGNFGGNRRGEGARGRVVAIDAETGEGLWRHEIAEVTAPPMAEEGTAYVVTMDGVLHLFDARTGDSPGTVRLADGPPGPDTMVAGGVVYFGDGGGRLRAAEITR